MPRVVVADKAGACYGVERALRLAFEAADAARGDAQDDAPRVHTLGPLIHNPQVVAELADKGVTAVADPSEAEPGSTLLMRAHGVTPAVEQAARDAGLNVIDATCPFVKRVHKAAERLASEGYQVVVAGEKGHAEVEGTVGHAEGALVAGDASEVADASIGRRVGVVAQTTLAHDTLREVVGALVGRCDELRVFDTICAATNERQEAAAEIARSVGAMLVVGGKSSANTRHLADICAAHCANTHHVEDASEIDAVWFAGVDVVGLTAGASTPAAQIDAARTAIEAL